MIALKNLHRNLPIPSLLSGYESRKLSGNWKKQRPSPRQEFPLARHGHCDVYFGARETVGGSSVSSGCWGEDSDHKKWMGPDTPTFAPIRYLFCSYPSSV